MPARLIGDEPKAAEAIQLATGRHWVCPVEAGPTPGAWAVRLRFTVVERMSTLAVFEPVGAFELFVDGASIARGSLSEDDPEDAARAFLELDLPPGRHEVFAYIWDFRPGSPTPAFAFTTSSSQELLATGHGDWQACRLKSVEALRPPSGRVLVSGEPTGPGGMDRGAEWGPVASDPDIDPAIHWYAGDTYRQLSQSEIGEVVVSGTSSGQAEEFATVFGSEGAFLVAAGETAVVRLQTPRGRILPVLRASGGPGSRVVIGFGPDPEVADVFEPRGFRQDFFSFEPFSGGEATITLEGGERGMALFRLRFLLEVDA